MNDDNLRNKMSYATWKSSKRFSIETIVSEWETLFN